MQEMQAEFIKYLSLNQGFLHQTITYRSLLILKRKYIEYLLYTTSLNNPSEIKRLKTRLNKLSQIIKESEDDKTSSSREILLQNGMLQDYQILELRTLEDLIKKYPDKIMSP